MLFSDSGAARLLQKTHGIALHEQTLMSPAVRIYPGGDIWLFLGGENFFQQFTNCIYHETQNRWH